MKNSKIKFSLMMFLIISLIIALSSMLNVSYAASYSVSSGISSIEQGKTYTITIKATGLTGKFNISHSSNVSVNCSSVWVENGVADTTIKVTAKSAGKATVTFSPDSVASASTGSLVSLSSKTDTVTVKENSSSSSSSDTTTTKPTFTSTNKTVYATGDINLRSSWSTSSSATPVSKGTAMTLTGTSSKTVNGYIWYRVSYNGSTKYVASGLVTTTKPSSTDSKNDDTKTNEVDDTSTENNSGSVNLKSLSVTPTGLSPVFSNGTTEYTMTVGSDIDEVEVEAVPEDSKASVDITGNTNLKIGTNKITITVTASDKTTKTYNITVTKEDKRSLQLSELLVEGLPLTPEFDSNIYEYALTLDRSDVSEVNITATPSEDDAEVEIVGNTDLKAGENVITILVTSEDGEEVATYQITVTLPKGENTAELDNQNLYLYIGIGIVAVLVIIIIIIALIRKNKHKDDDDELPKLRDEDLPKSLRKEKEAEGITEKENSQEKSINTVKEQENEEVIKTDRSKKIDEFYSAKDEVKPRKKGKHF